VTKEKKLCEKYTQILFSVVKGIGINSLLKKLEVGEIILKDSHVCPKELIVLRLIFFQKVKS